MTPCLHPIFLDVHPSVATTYSIARIYRNSFPFSAAEDGVSNPPTESLLAPEWPSARRLQNYAGALRRAADRPPPSDLKMTPAARAACHMWKSLLRAQADVYFREDRGRPGAALTALLHPLETIQRVLDTYRDAHWLTAELRRRIIRERLAVGTQDLHTIVALCVRSPQGWMNDHERILTIRILEHMRSDQSRDKMLFLWQAAAGDTLPFETIWSSFTQQVSSVLANAERHPVRTEVREGKTGYRRFLERLGVSLEPTEVYQHAQNWWIACKDEADRLARCCGLADWRALATYHSVDRTDGLIWVANNENLLHLYTTWAIEAQRQFAESGIVPPLSHMDIIDYRLMPARRKGNGSLASIQELTGMEDPSRRRLVQLLVAPTDDGDAGNERRRLHTLNGRLIAAHEMWHVIQKFHGVNVCPLEWRQPSALSLVPIEGSAMLAELLFLQIQNRKASPWLWLSMINGWLKRLARLMAEYEYHVLNYRLEVVTTNYAKRSNISPAEAGSDIARMTFDVGHYGSYVLGAWGFLSLAERLFNGSLPKCMAHVMHTSAGFVPAHLLAMAAGNDNLPLIPSTVCPVEASRQAVH